ncbi:MAG TPA: ABC transporter permease [Chitinophagaceae bacterium]|nr:ABC transporter permease [Chitinophagaceae bacterium]
MHKIWLIIKREYLTKVRKKTFILSTILFPLLYVLLIFGSTYLANSSGKKLNVAVVDSSGYFDAGRIARENRLDSSAVLYYVTTAPAILRSTLDKTEYDGFVVIPANANWETGLKDLSLETKRTMGLESSYMIQKKLNSIWSEVKNEKLGIDENKKKVMETSLVTISPINIKDKNANSGIASIIGSVAAILIYIILMLYGSQVMMGVMEEKTNRIAEVIISSVKPFQLMLGKIIGIGMVAFTQILIWLSFIMIIYNVSNIGSSSSMNNIIGGVQTVFTSTNIPLLFFFFIFYLMGGFFFYSSLFAAMGSAVNEDMREAQSLSFPLMMPIIFSMLMMGAVIKDPTGPVAFWGSMIPFSSPIIMMIRIPFGVPGTVPWWQLGLSMIILVAGFIFTTWFAGKIYRTGILMYGKKPSWKEMIRWAFRKN